VSMGAGVLHLAIPAISQELRPTNEQLLWVVDGYVFFLAGSLMTMGALADRIGRRRLLLVGGAAYGVLSLLAALSTTAQMLIVARMLLGVAGATLMPSTLSLIRSMFHDPRQRNTALGVWTASFALGGVVGPVVGGLLLGAFWWGSVFFIAPPVMLALVLLGRRLLPEFRDAAAEPLDLVSAVLSLVSVLLVVYAISRTAESGAGPAPVAALVVGTIAGGAFLRRQRRRPTFGLELFERPGFAIPVVTNGIAFFVLYGVQFVDAPYLQLVLGLSPLEAGLWTIPSALGYMLGSAVAPQVANRLSPRAALGVSVLVSAAGFALMIGVPAGGGLPLFVVAGVVLSVGLAPVYVVATGLAVSAAPERHAGKASALLETCTELGGAVGIAVLGSVAGIVFRAGMARSAPEGISAEAWREARGTIGRSVDVARDLPASVAADLLEAARSAFGDALQVVPLIGTVLLVVTAAWVVASRLGRSR
jgi:DHA2 family multidrug resistance protein-like MFS transporter